MQRRTYLLRVAYDGTGYNGFQRQPGQPTVQATIEDALWRLTGERHSIGYAGRTDTGVHAEDQVVRLETVLPTPAAVLAGLNAQLPESVVVRHAEEVDPAFDPRRNAVRRTYRYVIENSAWPSPFRRRYSWHVRPALDCARMHQAAQALLGEHNLSAFTEHSGVHLPSTSRRIDEARFERDGAILTFTISANAFLPHFVRNVVGTLVWIGRGRLGVNDMARILVGRDRTQAGPAAPGHGLFLIRVEYPEGTSVSMETQA